MNIFHRTTTLRGIRRYVFLVSIALGVLLITWASNAKAEPILPACSNVSIHE